MPNMYQLKTKQKAKSKKQKAIFSYIHVYSQVIIITIRTSKTKKIYIDTLNVVQVHHP